MRPDTSPAGLFVFLLIVSLACARLVRLTTTDTIFDRPRRWFNRRYTGMLVTLIQCPWCLSVWYAAGLVVLGYYEWTWARWPMLGLAVSAVVGAMAEKGAM